MIITLLQILELLCQILQTDSVASCKAWLDQASEAGELQISLFVCSIY